MGDDGEFQRAKGIRSRWREYEFIYLVVKHAIVPNLSIDHCIKHWNRIKLRLSEYHRQRGLQIDLYSYAYT